MTDWWQADPISNDPTMRITVRPQGVEQKVGNDTGRWWEDDPVSSGTSIGADVAKSGGIGLVKGGIDALGMFGDLRDVMHAGIDNVAKKFDISPEDASAFKKHMSRSLMLL